MLNKYIHSKKHLTDTSFVNVAREGIVDVETFVALDNEDFSRLQLNTGQRKKIQKYQIRLLEKYNAIPVKENAEEEGEDDFLEDEEEADSTKNENAVQPISLEKVT